MMLRRQETKMAPPQGIFFAGVLLLVLCSCGSFSSTTGNNNSTSSNPPEGIAFEQQSNLRIDVGSVPQMQVNSSQEIRVVLRPINNVLLSDVTLQNASMPSENATVTSTPIVTVGTPTATLLDAFGPGYTPYATATLNPAIPGLFTVTPEGAQGSSKEQPLNQTSILWKWLVFAKQPGPQVLDLEIDVTWKSQKQPQQGPYSIGGQAIFIDVLAGAPAATATPEQPATPTAIALVQTKSNPPTSGIDWTAFLTALAAAVGAFATLVGAIVTVIKLILPRINRPR